MARWLYGWMYRCVDGCMETWMDVYGCIDKWKVPRWINGWMYRCAGGCVDIWMCGCMDVLIYECRDASMEYGQMDIWMDAWMCGWMYGYMDAWMQRGSIARWMYESMDVEMGGWTCGYMGVWMFGCLDVLIEYGKLDVLSMDGWMDVQMRGWMYGCMDMCVQRCMDVWMYQIWMDVSMCRGMDVFMEYG